MNGIETVFLWGGVVSLTMMSAATNLRAGDTTGALAWFIPPNTKPQKLLTTCSDWLVLESASEIEKDGFTSLKKIFENRTVMTDRIWLRDRIPGQGYQQYGWSCPGPFPDEWRAENRFCDLFNASPDEKSRRLTQRQRTYCLGKSWLSPQAITIEELESSMLIEAELIGMFAGRRIYWDNSRVILVTTNQYGQLESILKEQVY